jgi:20S proteasome alpha/beta subunit
MTIAAGVVCADGVVIAADGEVTHNLVKTQKVKLFDCCALSNDVTIAGAGAGDELFVDVVVQKLREQIDGATSDLLDTKRQVERIVLQACQDAWPLYQENNKPDLQLLLGVKAADGMGLLEVHGPLVRSLPEFGCIGFGTDLAAYKSKNIFIPQLPLDAATPLLIHLVKVVKDNAVYCGGETSVWVVHLDGRIEAKDEQYIKKAESAYGALDMAINFVSHLLPFLRNPDGKPMTDVMIEAVGQMATSQEQQTQARNAIKILREQYATPPKQLSDEAPEQ